MNTADRSIGSIDYAVRRRFAFVQVGSNNDKIETSWGKDTGVGPIAKDLYNEFMGNGNENKGIFAIDLLADPELDVNDIKIGHTYFLGDKENKYGEEYLVYRIIYQIWPIYNEYIKDGLIDNSENQAANRFADCLYEALTEYRDEGKTIRRWRIYNEEKLKAFLIDTLIPNSDNKKKFEELESKEKK